MQDLCHRRGPIPTGRRTGRAPLHLVGPHTADGGPSSPLLGRPSPRWGRQHHYREPWGELSLPTLTSEVFSPEVATGVFATSGIKPCPTDWTGFPVPEPETKSSRV